MAKKYTERLQPLVNLDIRLKLEEEAENNKVKPGTMARLILEEHYENKLEKTKYDTK